MTGPGAATWLGAALLSVTAQAGAVESPEEADKVLEPIRVRGQRVALLQPANSYANLATALRYDPSLQIQARGLPEGQADVTVRGGLFENTGFRIGALTLFDPQTGHYAVEVPVDPSMLGTADVLTGADNAAHGFNASVATLQYRLRPVKPGGQALLGAGSDSLRYATVRTAWTRTAGDGLRLGAELAAAASRGDGSLPYGDHDFERFAARLSLDRDGRSTQLLAAYQDKFFGWPGAYTGFAALPETDHTKLGLLLADHRRDGPRGWWQLTAAWRQLQDDYDFDRRTVDGGGPGSFEHETRVAAVGFAARQRLGGLDWRFDGQFSADRLVRSTDLTGGDFNSRRYVFGSLAPTWLYHLGGGTLQLTPGLRFDWSNRDEDTISPLLSVSFERAHDTGISRLGFDYARTSQLPGYTALKSRPLGLFGGNPDLGREFADTVSLWAGQERGHWRWQFTVFGRHDRDLVDWTFRSGAPFLRQANAVAIDVRGLEWAGEWESSKFWALAGYAWLDKDADYGSAAVDASYYALNYARQRLTLALAWRPWPQLELRLDNEYRQQQENPLRNGSRYAWLAAAAAVWRPAFVAGAEAVLAASNLADDDFQEFPGTPPAGREFSLALRYGWR